MPATPELAWASYLLIHGHLIHISVERLAEVAGVFQKQSSLAHMLHCGLQPMDTISIQQIHGSGQHI